MSKLDAQRVERINLPVIDVDALRSPSPEIRNAAVAALRTACFDNGFFYISNHGIPDQLAEGVFSAARSLFELPAAVHALANHVDPLRGNRLDPLFAPDHESK